jgi:hypothetical protein
VLICLSGCDYYGLVAALHPTGHGTVMVFGSIEAHRGGFPPFAQPQDHLWISLLPDRFMARVLKIRQGRMQVQSATSLLFDAVDVGLHITDRTPR